MPIKKLPFVTFLLFWILLCFFSFTQKDPNLTIYNYPFIKDIISAIYSFGQNQKLASSIIFSVLSLSLFLNYLFIIKHSDSITQIDLIKIIAFLTITGIFAYPFLSHDIFNYLFNAKMVLVYGQNPHIHTALEFPDDLWIRFMHNTHTAAPYGQLFTIISLIPGFLGFGNFTLTLLLFKIFSALFFILCAVIIFHLAKFQSLNPLKSAAVFILNPLFLIETIINGHNDCLMLFFSFITLSLLARKPLKFKHYLFSILSYISSIFIKYATIVLAPIYLISQKIKIDFYLYSGIALFLILFTRIGQTHAWYLIWSFPFFILSHNLKSKYFAILLTFGGLIRYIPFINDNNFFPSQNYLLLFLPLIFIPFFKTNEKKSSKIK